MDFVDKTPDQIEKALRKLKVGDRIKFRAVTRSGAPMVWRKVNGFWVDPDLWEASEVFHSDHPWAHIPHKPTVRYHGWPNFVIKLNEILEIEKREEN